MLPLRLSPHAICITLLNRKFAYLVLWRNITHTVYGFIRTDIHVYTSHAKGKASTAKQTCLGSLLGLELNLHCVMISSFWRHPCQLELSRRYRETRPQSSANDWDLIPRLKCDSFGQNWLCTWGVVAFLIYIILNTLLLLFIHKLLPYQFPPPY